METERQSTPGAVPLPESSTRKSEYDKLQVKKGETVETIDGPLGKLVDLLQSKDSGRATHAVVESADGGTKLYVPVELIWDTGGDTAKICVSKEEATQLTRIPPQYTH
ncbi:MAG: hypothetical protein M1319_05630 [Chloroflexi bacterium]|nr:hypothetical protein [Chloroflexota bacterium]